MLGSLGSTMRVAAAIVVLVIGIAAPLVAAPSSLDQNVAMSAAAMDEVWGAGRKWWHCPVSLAMAALASGFLGTAGHALVAMAVVGCLS